MTLDELLHEIASKKCTGAVSVSVTTTKPGDANYNSRVVTLTIGTDALRFGETPAEWIKL
jgi:hypothetical protein